MAESTTPISFEGSLIDIDLTQTPNEYQRIEPGVYDLRVVDCKVEPNKNKTGYNAVAFLEVANDCPMKGNTIRDYMPLSSNPTMNVRFRLFVMSATGGVPAGRINLELVKDKVVRAKIVSRPDQNNPSKIYTNVEEYIVPPEILAANPTRK